MTDAYWHTRRGLWSVREGGRVVEHVPRLCLHGVTLVVRESAVARVRLRGQREVCAWATGTRVLSVRGGGGVRLRFCPFTLDAFATDEGTAVTRCRILHLEPNGEAWAWRCE